MRTEKKMDGLSEGIIIHSDLTLVSEERCYTDNIMLGRSQVGDGLPAEK